MTLDDDSALARAEADPVGFIADRRTPLVIDEIQRAPGLLLAIKSRVDRDDSRGQFLITGSANLSRLPTVPDALPGRVDYLSLWPFTQGEIAGHREDFLTDLLAGEVPMVTGAPVGRGQYVERLLAGGFPEARVRGGASRRRFFEG